MKDKILRNLIWWLRKTIAQRSFQKGSQATSGPFQVSSCFLRRACSKWNVKKQSFERQAGYLKKQMVFKYKDICGHYIDASFLS